MKKSAMVLGAVFLVIVFAVGNAHALLLTNCADYTDTETGVPIVDGSSATEVLALGGAGLSITDVDLTVTFTKSGSWINPDGTPTGGFFSFLDTVFSFLLYLFSTRFTSPINISSSLTVLAFRSLHIHVPSAFCFALIFSLSIVINLSNMCFIPPYNSTRAVYPYMLVFSYVETERRISVLRDHNLT